MSPSPMPHPLPYVSHILPVIFQFIVPMSVPVTLSQDTMPPADDWDFSNFKRIEVLAVSDINMYRKCGKDECQNTKIIDKKCPRCNTDYDDTTQQPAWGKMRLGARTAAGRELVDIWHDDLVHLAQHVSLQLPTPEQPTIGFISQLCRALPVVMYGNMYKNTMSHISFN